MKNSLFRGLSLCMSLLFLSSLTYAESRKNYYVNDFGIHSSLTDIQTESIQKMINAVSKKGGGIINFPAGTYVTGSIDIKSDVQLNLDRGAVILGSTSPYDYIKHKSKDEPVSPNANDNSALALITSNGARNIAITGQGIIDGRGRELALTIDSLHHKGILVDPKYNYHRNRPNETARPKLFRISQVDGMLLKDVSLRNSACWGVTVELSRNVVMENLNVYNRAYWNNDGLDITDCRNVTITRCNIDAADDGICLKSYYPGYSNDSITITDCRVCSSASAVKFGTASHGGFQNIVIDNIEVYDTYRSAIAIETVDGGFLKDVTVTRINARNTGNAIFMRLGHRAGKAPGILKNIYIGQMKVEIPFGRPDEDYDLRGPALPFFHNPFPSSIVGIPGNCIENVKIEDIDILHPGRASKGMAYVSLWRLNSVPEEIKSYPEFTMFGELPSWGFYIRHAKNVSFKNIRLRLANEDFRPAFVFDDVESVTFENLQLPAEKNQIVIKDSKNIKVEPQYNILKY